MNKIGCIEWYKYQPLKAGKFYGTTKDWNQTLVASINMANATLVRNSLKKLTGDDSEIPAIPKPKRKLIIASNLVNIVESLDYYDSYFQRYNTAYSIALNENIMQLIEDDDYVEIIIKDGHKPDND